MAVYKIIRINQLTTGQLRKMRGKLHPWTFVVVDGRNVVGTNFKTKAAARKFIKEFSKRYDR